MAITLDNAADLGQHNSGTNLPFTTAGTNRILFVGLTLVAGAETITGVTYAGVAMTQVQKQVTGTGLNADTYLYCLANPALGANNVVVTCSSVLSPYVGAVSYNGAAAFQPDNSNANLSTGTPTSYTTDLITGNDNDWVVLMENSYNNNNAPTAGTGSTRRTYEAVHGSWGLFDSNAAVTPAGDYSMTTGRTTTPASNIVHLMASFKPFVANYTISGTILDGSSNPVSGVTVSCTGQSNTSTSGSGTYSFAGLAAGTYTVTPTKVGWTFAPTSVSPTISADTVENFTGTNISSGSAPSGPVAWLNSSLNWLRQI